MNENGSLKNEYKGYEFNTNDGTMTISQYKHLIDLLEEYQPKRICEFGSGQSTLIFEKYCQKTGAYLVSIEHDLKWKKKQSIIFNLIQNSTLTVKDRVFENCNKYEGLESWLETQEPFDFIFIDGPPGWGFRQNYKYGRVQVMDFLLLNKLTKQSIVLVHDSQRENMQRTLRQFQKILFERNYEFGRFPDDNRNKLLTTFYIKLI